MAEASLGLCPPSLDRTLGPVVNRCLRSFDFTLLFEQSILSLLPSAIFLLAAAWRGWDLRSEKRRATGGILASTKLVTITAVAALQLATAMLWSKGAVSSTEVSVASSAVAFVAACVLAPLSWCEHVRSIKPSYLISGYLLLATTLDLPQIRTLWLIRVGNRIPSVFSAVFATRILLLCLECIHKSRSLISAEDAARSPEDKHGVISRSFMWWIVPLLYRGSRRTIRMVDLYPTPIDAAPKTLEEKLKSRWSHSSVGHKYRLLKVTARAISRRLFTPVIPRICMIGFTVTQPVLLLRLISFLNANPTSPDDGYGLLGAYGLVYLGLAISRVWYFHQNIKFSTAVRAGLVAVIYDKILSLDTSAIEMSSAVTLMSADMERIVLGLRSVHDIWANVIQVALAAWLLEREVGVAIVAAVIIAVACSYATLMISGAAGDQQTDWLGKIEKRVDATMSTLSSMRGVKMSGLAGKMMEYLQVLRAAELHSAANYRRWEVGAVVMAFFPVMISPVLTFAIYIGAKNTHPLDASRIFVSLSLMTLISQPLSMLLQAGPEMMSMVASFQRIGQFMETEQRDDVRQPQPDSSASSSRTTIEKSQLQANVEEIGNELASTTPVEQSGILIKNGQFGWKKDSRPVLRNVDLHIPSQKLTMVVGPVGCGKTTLLKGILREVPFVSGSIDLPTDSVSFCDQSPWIIHGSVKRNVVMFSGDDGTLYDTVLRACALSDDLDRLPDGDHTPVGSNGITLSGGQKSRLSVARALFARRDINLFDDVLSGLDADTQVHVFSNVFGHDGLLGKRKATTVLVTHAVHFLPFADYIVCIGADGEVVQHGSFAELSQTPGYVRDLNISPDRNLSRLADEADTSHPAEMRPATSVVEQDVSFQHSKPNGVYRFYVKAVGHWSALIYVLIAVLYAFLYNFPYIWAEWWADENTRNPGGRQAYFMGIYALLQILCLVSLVFLAWHAVITIITTSGNALHWIVLSTTLGAPLSFFETTDTGTTLNRFGQDMQMIDNELPLALLDIACSGLILLGQLLLIMNVSYWIAISFIAIFTSVWILQSIYLRTSRQLRHLELETKAPLYALFVEALESLPTIRVFNWSTQFKELNYKRLDESQRPFYLLLCIQRWLSLVLDCLALGFALLIIGLIVGLRDRISSGLAGVALSNMLNLSSSLTNLVEVWTQLETSIASVQRIRDFKRDTPSEIDDLDLQDTPPDWPDKGAISIQDLSATYRKGTTQAFKGLTMHIKPGEKIGVAGRTASGKSSLMLALFKMIDISSGSITIDGVDIATVHPNHIRDVLNAISQESYFMPGTIRANADPSGIRSDTEIADALWSVRLGEVIEAKGGLDAEIKGDTFSQGEKQLFCLARAMLKRSRIVVLDEATSNLDLATEKLIHEVITERFKDFTVITIAHRLETIVNSDRIAVLDAGMLVEFETPHVLMTTNSRFRSLYKTFKRE